MLETQKFSIAFHDIILISLVMFFGKVSKQYFSNGGKGATIYIHCNTGEGRTNSDGCVSGWRKKSEFLTFSGHHKE